MTDNRHEKPMLITGGTGKTGRRIAQRLTERGVSIRIGTPSSDPPFDWEDQSTWGPALQGVGSVHISYFPDLAIPGAVASVRSFAELAIAHGTRRLVLLSGRGEKEAERGERAVQETDADLTVVRCAFFMQNFSENYLVEPIQAGEVVLPARDQLDPFVDADDIADVVVAALTDDRHIGEVYELTGPRLLTYPEAVGEIAAAIGRDIRYVPVSVEEYEAVMIEENVPEEFRWLLSYVFGEVLGGRPYLTDGLQRALGRPPRDFSEFVRDTAATGVWDVSAAVPSPAP
jgi:uncharacterized protein YbjT (DUF2867 family)